MPTFEHKPKPIAPFGVQEEIAAERPRNNPHDRYTDPRGITEEDIQRAVWGEDEPQSDFSLGYRTVVEGWLRDWRGTDWPEGSIDDLSKRVGSALRNKSSVPDDPPPPSDYEVIMQRTIDREIADERMRDMLLLLGVFMTAIGITCISHALGWF